MQEAEIQLTDALASRIGKAAFAGLKFSGQRYDWAQKSALSKRTWPLRSNA